MPSGFNPAVSILQYFFNTHLPQQPNIDVPRKGPLYQGAAGHFWLKHTVSLLDGRELYDACTGDSNTDLASRDILCTVESPNNKENYDTGFDCVRMFFFEVNNVIVYSRPDEVCVNIPVQQLVQISTRVSILTQ